MDRPTDQLTDRWTKRGEWLPCLQFSINFRKLNKVTMFNTRLIPCISEMLDAMPGCTWFSKMDIQSAFNQIELTEQLKNLTAFCIPGQRPMRYKRMTFGLSSASQMYLTLMDLILYGIQWKFALTYIDNLVFFSFTWEEHVVHVEDLLAHLKIAGKCKLFHRKIDMLGHHVGPNGILLEENKIKCVKEWPELTSNAILQLLSQVYTKL